MKKKLNQKYLTLFLSLCVLFVSCDESFPVDKVNRIQFDCVVGEQPVGTIICTQNLTQQQTFYHCDTHYLKVEQHPFCLTSFFHYDSSCLFSTPAFEWSSVTPLIERDGCVFTFHF